MTAAWLSHMTQAQQTAAGLRQPPSGYGWNQLVFVPPACMQHLMARDPAAEYLFIIT